MRICFQAVLVSIAAAGAARTDRVPSDVPVLLTAVVRHHAGRLAELDRRFTDVSTPGHPDHARFLTQTEALALLDPGADRLDAVIGWLTDALGTATLSGLSVSPTSDVLRLETTVGGAEALGMVCSPRRHFEYKIADGPASGPPPPKGITPVGCSLSPSALADAGMGDHIRHVEAAGSVRKSRLRRRAARQAPAATLPLGCQEPNSGPPPPPCPGPPPNPGPYSTAVFPPGPVVPSSLVYGGTMFRSAINPISPYQFIEIMPRCLGALSSPRVLVPISRETADNPAYWTNKTTNPCNDGLPVTMYTVTVTTQNGTRHSSSIPAEELHPLCTHTNQSVCVIDGDTPSAKLYPSTVCPFVFFGLNFTTNEGYSIDVTLEIGSQYNVTEQVSTFVPATGLDIVNASVPGSELPAPVYVTQEKLADDMRAWYDIPSTTKVSPEAKPQAYGILVDPAIGTGSYRPEDLSTAYTLNGISQDLLGQAHFLEVPVVVPNRTGPVGQYLTQMGNITGNTATFLPAPCTINNAWVACNCGPAYGTVVNTGTETSLDVQMTAVSTQGGHTYGIHSGYWSTNGPRGIISYTDGLLTTAILMVADIVMAILLGDVVPWTLSFSYGFPIGCKAYIASLSAIPYFTTDLLLAGVSLQEIELLFRGETAMIEVMDAYFQALGAIGVSVLASSGDQGSRSSGCMIVPFLAQAATNAGCSLAGTPSYFAVYPAASPYVTAVGGTGLAAPPAGTVGGPACRNFGNHSTNGCVTEQVISIATHGGITSGGGFAPQVAQPLWQHAPIASYLTKVNLSDTAGYPVPDNNSTALGAGFPDLAAFAGNIMLVAGGIVMAEGGTSAASPFTAGMVSLLNSELQKQGAGPLGFLNPMLYGAPPSVFNDIVDGNNNCRGQSAYTMVCCEHGYQAAEGWDPASGLGSLNFTAMLDYALATLYPNATPPASLPPWVPLSTGPTTAAITCPVSQNISVNISAPGVCPDAFVGVGSGANTVMHQPTVAGPTTEAPVMPPTSRPSGGVGPLHLVRNDLEKLSAGDEVGIGIGTFALILICCVVGCYCYTERGSKGKGAAGLYDDPEHRVHLLVG